MSQEQNFSNLRRKCQETRNNLESLIYEKYEPRFYKVKVKRKLEYINPWKDLIERNAVESQIAKLWNEWLKLFQEYFALTGDRLEIPIRYIQEETPNGPRWVKAVEVA